MQNINLNEKVPNFELEGTSNLAFNLKDFMGKYIIIYFYPKDLTPGCTVESCNLRDNYADLLKTGFDVVGVSADDEKKHLRFIDKHDLPFHLLGLFIESTHDH